MFFLMYHVSCEPLRVSGMTIQPARHECLACCPPQAEKPGIQPVVGNTHGTRPFQIPKLVKFDAGGSEYVAN